MIIRRKTDDASPIEEQTSVSTGSALLNLALSDSPYQGFLKGHFFYLVGDSASGKSFYSMTCLAESAKNPHFEEYRFIYDNVEDGLLMDIERFFGAEVARRVEPPEENDGVPVFSETVEGFYYHLDDAIKKGKPFIYILDSMDALTAEADDEKFEQQKKAHQKGNQKVAGSYGMAKAKQNSVMLRKALKGLRATGSILIVISQTRDAVNTIGWETKTRAGGRALRFYATCEIWTSLAGAIKKTIRGKPRKIGNYIQIQVKKNRITGKLHTVKTAIYPSYGIDDIGSCVDFLIDEKWWPKRGNKYHAKELGCDGSREELIHLCETKKRKKLMRSLARCWEVIESESALKRKPRYQ